MVKDKSFGTMSAYVKKSGGSSKDKCSSAKGKRCSPLHLAVGQF